jgi:hypothetical protein
MSLLLSKNLELALNLSFTKIVLDIFRIFFPNIRLAILSTSRSRFPRKVLRLATLLWCLRFRAIIFLQKHFRPDEHERQGLDHSPFLY